MRLLTGLSIAAAGVGTYFMLRKKKSKSKSKNQMKQMIASGKIRSDLEKTINKGIHRLLNTSDELIRDYSKRGHRTIKQAKKRKKYVTL